MTQVVNKPARRSAKEICAMLVNSYLCECGEMKSCDCCLIFCHACEMSLSLDIRDGMRGAIDYATALRFIDRAINCLRTQGRLGPKYVLRRSA